MRIGIYAPNMGTSTPSGVERYVFELVGALARAPGGHEFVLFSDAAAWPLPPASRRVPLPPMGWIARHRYDHGKVSPLANAEKLDVLHCPKSVVPPGLDCPGVATIHDVIFLHHPEFYPFWWRWYWTRALRRSAERAAAIVCVSKTTADDVERHLPEARGKVHAVASGVNAGFFAGAPARPPAPGGPYFLYVGNITVRKNLHVLMDAWERIRGRVRAELCVAGAIDFDGADIVARFPGLGVRHVARAANEELSALYHGAVALVYPSRYEGFGLPVLEAMASGCPVIASTGGALPEVVGDAGVLVGPDDVGGLAEAMVRVEGDAAFRADLVRRGLARAAEFTWERTAAGVLEVYAAACGKKAAHEAPARA